MVAVPSHHGWPEAPRTGLRGSGYERDEGDVPVDSSLSRSWPPSAHRAHRVAFGDSCESGSDPCFPGRADPFEVTTDGVLAELPFFPGGQNGPWVLSGLLNRVDSDRRAVSLRVGEVERGP